MAEQGAMADTLTWHLENKREALVAEAVQAGLTRQQAERLIEQWGLVPEVVETLVELEGLDAAMTAASGWEAQLGRLQRTVTATIQARVTGMGAVNQALSGAGLQTRHMGGLIGGAAGPPRFHGGGVIGKGAITGTLAPTERLIIGEVGERVLSVPQTQAFDAFLRTMGQPGQPGGAGGPAVSVYIGDGMYKLFEGKVRAEVEEGKRSLTSELGGVR